MSEDRKKILDMLAEGKISVDDTERLLDAVDTESSSTDSRESSHPGPQSSPPSYLHVNVEPKVEGGDVVDIKIPIKLLVGGVKLLSLLPDGVYDTVNEAAEENGVDLGLEFKKLNTDNSEELLSELAELKVDIDSENARVRIFCQ